MRTALCLLPLAAMFSARGRPSLAAKPADAAPAVTQANNVAAAPAARSAEPAEPKLPPLKPLFDYPLRDTSVCVGGDGLYYLTGTTGHPTWWKTNEGIRVWRSADLKTWEPLGLVWKIDNDTWQKQKHGESSTNSPSAPSSAW